jgi:EmrB/QacA subfamily drug resistance transporter
LDSVLQSESRRTTRTITLVVASALFMENLDSTVIATSLPQIAGDLGVDPVLLKLAFTSYLVSLAIFIPVSGWLADRIGARHVFRAAVLVFTLASIGCALADDLPTLVAARFAQGLGGAMMVPVGRLIVLRAVPKHEMVANTAWLTVPALIAPVIGPPIGGFVTTYYHWRWIFWLNVPFGLLGILLASLLMPKGERQAVPPFDWLGFGLCGLGLSAVVFGSTLIGRDVLGGAAGPLMAALGLGVLALYVAHARRIAHPVLDLALLRIPAFRACVVGGTLFRVGAGALPFLLPLMLQLGFGLSAFASGMLTFVAAAGALLMKLTAAPILRRYGFRQVLLWNGLLSAGLLGATALFTPATPHAVIMAVLLVAGFFRSLQFTSINTLGYADIAPPEMSRATSFAAVAQQVSLSLGVAAAALVLEASQAIRGDEVLVVADFAIAFIAVAAVSALSAPIFARLPSDIGSEVSGHRAR